MMIIWASSSGLRAASIKIEVIYFCLCIISFIISVIMSSLDTVLNDDITSKQKKDAIEKALSGIFCGKCDQYEIDYGESDLVYDLLINKIIPVFTTDTSSEIYMFLARFYQLEEDYDNMIKYDLLAIEKGNVISMLVLGCFFKDMHKYENMLKYFLMGIDRGCKMCSCSLGNYYYKIQNFDAAIKYYLISIAAGSINAMINVGHCYYYKKDTINTVKYYLMAYDNGRISIANDLGDHYKGINDFDNMIKYYLIAINNGFFDNLDVLFNHYIKNNHDSGLIVFHKLAIDKIPKANSYLSQLLLNASSFGRLEFINTVCLSAQELQIAKNEIVELKSYIDELELLPEGPKYAEAKKHFESLSTASTVGMS
jgi:tetratricopeptide (TPR) repeat protein